MPPVPDPPSGARLALVVATSTYTDPGLRQLRAPARDADDLAQVLADPGIGGFTVTTVIDQPAQQIRLAIEDFLVGRGTGDLLLVRDAPALFRTVRKSQPLSAVAFSPDSRWLALGDLAGFARLEEVTSGTEGLMVQHPGPVLGLAFSQDGRWLATMDEGGTARIWDAISGKERLA